MWAVSATRAGSANVVKSGKADSKSASSVSTTMSIDLSNDISKPREVPAFPPVRRRLPRDVWQR
ncbi:hypothetical protein MINTM008_39070 [Mycobacterium intracellulare]|nr:hypothetical protein MINTM002_36360 [Mycobacterium intracellulare]BCP38303.1 hypothetical protein MINTMi198_36730 [Mycobacterium intracellulare M.i.198]BCO58486.1 hypothetical protein MINTM005_37300 [Mycobacterium intracellulare]BCO63743.1 hypothetical protein MINTM006_36930 [Mycobacterium intracellulare]BCO69055.1 hypothetical protein MINTM007_36660 [Mycobacterium intracellulare]